MSAVDERIKDVVLYAWIGEDELGSGQIGLKQGLVPAGYIPLVSVRQDRMLDFNIPEKMQAQATRYGKTIRLCKFTFAGVVKTLEPKGAK